MRSTNRPFPRALRVPALALSLLLAAAACGSDASDTGTGDTGTGDTGTGDTGTGESDGDGVFPLVIDTADGELTIGERPDAIVSMSPTATEMLFAIGAGDQVIAVDSLSNHPPGAPVTELSAFEPNVEAIAAEEPDLVVLGFPDEVVQDGLADLGIPVLLQLAATDLDDTYGQIADLGLVTGNVDGAAAVNTEIRAGVEEVLAGLPPAPDGDPVRVYHELDDTFYSASSGSYIGQLYALLGYENIADTADPDGSIQYPQLQAEQVLAADPTLIVITDAYGYGPDAIGDRPGWDVLSAVANGNVVQVDTDVASRWGPRVVEFLQQIAAAAPVPVGS